MIAARVPWSFRALAFSSFPLGGVLLFGMCFSYFVRQGMAVELDFTLLHQPMNRLLGLGVAAGVVGFPFLPLALALANLTTRPTLAFYILAPGIPAMIFVVGKAWLIGSAARGEPLEPLRVAEHLLDLPDWLTLLTLVAAFAAAAWCYMRLLRAKDEPEHSGEYP